MRGNLRLIRFEFLIRVEEYEVGPLFATERRLSEGMSVSDRRWRRISMVKD